MAYTTINKPNLYFDTQLWTGTNASGRTFTGLNFQPDFIWNKCYNSSNYYFNIVDIVRGGTKFLATSVTSVEDTASHGQITSWNSNGTTWADGTNATYPRLYYNDGAGSTLGGSAYVSWNWSCGGTGVSNTAGSITSTVSANQTAGCSIVSFTTIAGGNATIGHGLGSVPKMIIMKARDQTYNWDIYHVSIGNANRLTFTTAASAATPCWGSTTPTSSVFTMDQSFYGSGIPTIAYCFAEIKGYSKFGSYAGNNALDGTFVYTGFSPSFVLVKRYGGGAQNWVIYDDKRNTYNVTNSTLRPNTAAAEATNNAVDLLSNGFKFRSNDGDSNGYSDGYIYMAFAENPFVSSTQIPTTAR